MSEIEKTIEILEYHKRSINVLTSYKYSPLAIIHSIEKAIQALQEKAEREERMQWLNDMNNPLESIKVQAALESEMLKYNYRKEHKPDSISPLDCTIIYALNKVLEDELKGGAEGGNKT